MTTVDFTDSTFLKWRETLPEQYQALMKDMHIEQIGALSDIQLERRGLLLREWENIVSGHRTKKAEADADRRFRYMLEIKEHLALKTIRDSQQILYYEDGVYKPGGEVLIKELLQQIGGAEITNYDRNEALAAVRASTGVNRGDFDADSAILNFKNGLYNIITRELKEHTPEYLSLIQLPVDFDRNAGCRNVIEFLYDIIANPRDVPLVLEFMGYSLLGHKHLQKELLLVGAPSSGKSVYLFLITALLGSKNVSNITMQQLSSNRFALAQLDGKLANVYADISHAKLEDVERFKAVATADEVEAEHKGMQMFKFQPRAKLVFSANVPPRPPETVDDSYYRRWIIIQCALRDTHYFSGEPIVKDPELLQQLTTPENLSGLLNLVLISARRLMHSQRFCREIPTDQTRELYDRLSNPVQLWVEQCCEEDGDSVLEVSAGYRSYVDFCRARKIGVTTKEWLGKELGRLGFVTEQRGTGKNKRRVWVGIGTRNLPFPSLIQDKNSIEYSTIEKGKGTARVPILTPEVAN